MMKDKVMINGMIIEIINKKVKKIKKENKKIDININMIERNNTKWRNIIIQEKLSMMMRDNKKNINQKNCILMNIGKRMGQIINFISKKKIENIRRERLRKNNLITGNNNNNKIIIDKNLDNFFKIELMRIRTLDIKINIKKVVLENKSNLILIIEDNNIIINISNMVNGKNKKKMNK